MTVTQICILVSVCRTKKRSPPSLSKTYMRTWYRFKYTILFCVWWQRFWSHALGYDVVKKNWFTTFYATSRHRNYHQVLVYRPHMKGFHETSGHRAGFVLSALVVGVFLVQTLLGRAEQCLIKTTQDHWAFCLILWKLIWAGVDTWCLPDDEYKHRFALPKSHTCKP